MNCTAPPLWDIPCIRRAAPGPFIIKKPQMGPILPGCRREYRTTSGAFKWIVFITILGAIGLFFAFREGLKDVDRIYEAADFPADSRFIKTPAPPPVRDGL